MTSTWPLFSENAAQSESTEIRPDWKPPFLSNEEFTQLMLEVRILLWLRQQTGTCVFKDCRSLSGSRWIFPRNNDGWEYNLCLWERDVPTWTLTCEYHDLFCCCCCWCHVVKLCPLFQSDLVDQNLLNFLPAGEHSEVYKALSSHIMEGETLTPEYLKSMSTFYPSNQTIWIF